jgi:peptidyl-prolyl cis-trans isomerase-like 2
MGKLRHNKDRGFLTGVEWKELGGFKEKRSSGLKRLPFDHCALSLVPFETPMLAPDGSVFELTRIVPFLKAHKKNPVTGDALESKDLLALHFSKNTDGNYICPVTGKPLTEHTRIVVVRTTGNVFSFDAVNQLCLGPKNMKDLIDDTPFTRADLVFIQDPTDAEFLKRHDVNNFAHVLDGDKPPPAASAAAGTAANPGGGTIRLNDASRKVFEEMEVAAAEKKRAREAAAATDATAASAAGDGAMPGGGAEASHVASVGVKTSGRFTASFTSTGVSLVTRNEAGALSAAEVAEKRIAAVRALGKKAFVRLETNHGNLNLELDVPLAPRTCENFLLLARRGYYDGSVFHRSIRNFMVRQGQWGWGVATLMLRPR